MPTHTALLCCVASLAILLNEDANAASVRMHYTGRLIQRDAAGGATPARAFGLAAWPADDDPQGAVLYRVDDEGRGGLEWWERVGWAVDRRGEESSRPRLRHIHLGRAYTLALPAFRIAPDEPLDEGLHWEAEWEGRRMQFDIVGQQRRKELDCWEVAGSSDTGRWQTWFVEKDSGLVVEASVRAFIGRGERFDLELELDRREDLAEEVAAAEREIGNAMTGLIQSLRLNEQTSGGDLSEQQLAAAAAALPPLQQQARGTDWQRFLETTIADTEADRRKQAALTEMTARMIGKPAPAVALIDAAGTPIGIADRQTVVLHFWEYRGTPEAPFGQVGYLDFLSEKLRTQDVRVIGVAVDERAADPAQLKSVRREVRKFTTEFMKLNYPVAIDDGTALKKFGDPRAHEASLPLWIVIAADGVVAHSRTGLYPLDPNRGLEELEQIVTRVRQSGVGR